MSAPPTQPAEARSSRGADMRSLVDQANQALADYRRLTSEGRLGDAGSKLDELKRVLEQMSHSSPASK